MSADVGEPGRSHHSAVGAWAAVMWDTQVFLSVYLHSKCYLVFFLNSTWSHETSILSEFARQTNFESESLRQSSSTIVTHNVRKVKHFNI